jgi:hypothetical protein
MRGDFRGTAIKPKVLVGTPSRGFQKSKRTLTVRFTGEHAGQIRMAWQGWQGSRHWAPPLPLLRQRKDTGRDTAGPERGHWGLAGVHVQEQLWAGEGCEGSNGEVQRGDQGAS